jgi:hypothetical protein
VFRWHTCFSVKLLRALQKRIFAQMHEIEQMLSQVLNCLEINHFTAYANLDPAKSFFFKLTPYTLAGFDLTTIAPLSSVASGDGTLRPPRQRSVLNSPPRGEM